MDRPSQEPPEPAIESSPAEPPRAGGVDAGPLSFPVEAPRPERVEPGAGTPFETHAAVPPPADSFPDAQPPAEPLPFPVAQLPGMPQTAPEPDPVPVPLPEAEPDQPLESRPSRLVPAFLTSAAALLTVGSLFLPLFRLDQQIGVRQRILDARLTITQTAWGIRIEFPGQETAERAGAPVGIPLIVAVILLAVAAFTAFSRPERPSARWLVAAGAVFTAGVVLTVGMTGLEFAALVGPEADMDAGPAAGMWLLIVATVLAAAAAVVAYLPLRRETTDGWADPAVAYADTPTPPTGVAITVLPPEKPEQPEKPE